MKRSKILIIAAWLTTCLVLACQTAVFAQLRTWSDATGQFTLEARLVTFNEAKVVLQRGDGELVAIPIEQLSEADQEHLKTPEATQAVKQLITGLQTWKLRDGTEITGRVVDYVQRDITLQRRRGRFYLNDRRIQNLPEFYQRLLPQIVGEFVKLSRDDMRGVEQWLIEQRGEPRRFILEGVLLEFEDGDEYGVPFFLLNDEQVQLLKPGWHEWLKAHEEEDYTAVQDQAFLLESLAAALLHDNQIKRDIAMMQLELQAVQAGLTSLWEVTLYPQLGEFRPPIWVVVPGRNSEQAAFNALQMNPGYVVGPIRRVSGGLRR